MYYCVLDSFFVIVGFGKDFIDFVIVILVFCFCLFVWSLGSIVGSVLGFFLEVVIFVWLVGVGFWGY